MKKLTFLKYSLVFFFSVQVVILTGQQRVVNGLNPSNVTDSILKVQIDQKTLRLVRTGIESIQGDSLYSHESNCVYINDRFQEKTNNGSYTYFEEEQISTNTIISGLSCDERIFNMVFAYTPEVFAQRLASDPDLLLSTTRILIDGINTTLQNSGINARARLVHCFVLSEAEGAMPNSDDDTVDSTKTAHMQRLISSTDGVWDEIWDYRSRYKASVTALVSNNRYGGRAQRTQARKFVIYGWSQRMLDGFGFAHEVGHCLGLEHRRETFSSSERFFLDSKKAYGYRGTNHSTVMIQAGDLSGTQAELRYSNPNVNFPDGEAAGNNMAQAALHAQNNTSLLITPYSDEQRLPATITIDYALDNNSFTLIQAQNNIVVDYGFTAELGSSFIMQTGVTCLEE